jgi:ribosomal protein S18 acetylase RimI-like enzyme
MDVRPLGPGDGPALRRFFEGVPEGDRTFFREDVLAPGTVEGWLAGGRAARFLAVDGDEVVGYLAILPGVGWSAHVGELRVVVSPSRRRVGLGRELARRGLVEGVGLGLDKLVVEVVAEQEAAVGLFADLGFEAEALLRAHVRDSAGVPHALLVMAHHVSDTWSAMASTGIIDLVEP